MAAYCRVSTDQAEQLQSYEAQVQYYTTFIQGHPDYDLAGIYADEGISATNTKKREQFLRMIEYCKAGTIDMIITKSISRFARNTLDCLNYVRLLKDLGIGVIFEKENINTLDSKGEVLLSILSSLAQDESRSISENSTWGIRRRFEQGRLHLNYTKFLGYTKDQEGNLIIDDAQAAIVRRIYHSFLAGKGCVRIAQEFENEQIPKWNGGHRWFSSNILSILMNEKYKGDALLQKTYTVDFLSKKRAVNEGVVPQYYVENSHVAIIDKDTWEAVQLEMKRRKDFAERHGIHKIDLSTDKSPFSGKVICGCCEKFFQRKVWNSNHSKFKRTVWQCSSKYAKKGFIGCNNTHVDDKIFYEALIQMYNDMVRQKEVVEEKWQTMIKSDDVWLRVTANRFLTHFKKAAPIQELDTDLVYSLVEKVTVQKGKSITFRLLDGTESEFKFHH